MTGSDAAGLELCRDFDACDAALQTSSMELLLLLLQYSLHVSSARSTAWEFFQALGNLRIDVGFMKFSKQFREYGK